MVYDVRYHPLAFLYLFVNVILSKAMSFELGSFPNSGTSFTSKLIRMASNATTATNYGLESLFQQKMIGRDDIDRTNAPVYEWSQDGPYWIHPPAITPFSANKLAVVADDDESKPRARDATSWKDLPPPTASILTKTHCGSRCTVCPPQDYLETDISFLMKCLSGARRVAVSLPTKRSAMYKKKSVMYHPSLVERAVHLLRNPFNNIVSRFHHEQKEHMKRGDRRWIGRYNNSAAGFKLWCSDVDEVSMIENDAVFDWAWYGLPGGILDVNEKPVPCRAELFRYVHCFCGFLVASRGLFLLKLPCLNFGNVSDHIITLNHTQLRPMAHNVIESAAITRVTRPAHVL